MTQAAFDFEVITPDGQAFRARVTSLGLAGRDGRFGILARHAPLVAALDVGVLSVRREDGAELDFAAGEGFVEVRRAGVRALVDFCDTKEDVDVERARRAAERARERVRSRDRAVDHARAESALRRALVRLQIAGAD